jgi:ABC-type phosphate/phosphonate transport system substrate-binding protein
MHRQVRAQGLRIRPALAFLLLWGCASAAPGDSTVLPEGPAGGDGPLRILLGVNEPYCAKTACKCVDFAATRDFEPLRRKLREKHGIELELRYYPGDLFELRRRVRAGDLEGAVAKPWPVLKEAREAGRDWRRVADLPGPGGDADLRGVAVVPKESPIRSWADLAGKRLAIGQADAYEKHHAALDLLRRQGVDPGRVRLLEFSSCLENVGAILDGKADAAVVSDYSFDADCLVDVARLEDFRVLGRTEPAIPLVSLMVDAGRVPAAAANRLRRALLGLNGDPGLGESLLGKGFERARPWSPPELPPLAR